MKPGKHPLGRSRRWLEQDEVVVYASAPHPFELARPALAGTMALAAAIAGFVAWRSAPVWFGLVLGGVLLVDALVLAARLAAHRSTVLIVTSVRIVHRQGVLRREGREIPISRVEDVVYVQSILGRLLGYGTLTVESASSAPAAPFGYVRAPEQVQHEIHRAGEAARSVRGRPFGEPAREREPSLAAPTSTLPSGPDHLALLEDLYRRGIVSETELEEKRTELLGRA